jgi:hypothetical protein
MKDFKLELGFDVLDKPFRFADNKTHVPTIKISLPACVVDDMEAFDDRDRIGAIIRELLTVIPDLD